MVYDDKTRSLLLFGGGAHDSIGDVNDTWTWDGSTWTQLHPATSPSPRDNASLAYDAASGLVVLFGGADPRGTTGGAIGGKFFGDTWTWDGSNWTQMFPSVSPPARANASMVYDAATKQTVLFGGGGDGPRAVNQSLPSLNDTWTWDGSNWTQQQPATSPPVRQRANMTYNVATQNVVLFGGFDYNIPQQLVDTWTWDGSNWTQQQPATSPAISMIVKGKTLRFDTESSMIYDSSIQRTLLMCNGYDAASERSLFEAIWIWDGSNWTQQNIVGPEEGYQAGMLFYDTALHAVIQLSSFLPKNSQGVFTDIFVDELWKWNGHGWDTLEAWNK
jgi:hypothetical protein